MSDGINFDRLDPNKISHSYDGSQEDDATGLEVLGTKPEDKALAAKFCSFQGAVITSTLDKSAKK